MHSNRGPLGRFILSIAAAVTLSCPLLAVRPAFADGAAIVAPTAPAVFHAAPATPSPAPTAAMFGADLGVPRDLVFVTSASACSQHAFLDSQVAKCESAVGNKQIVLAWSFDPNSCSSKPCRQPDGFNVSRSANGSLGPFNLSMSENADPKQTAASLSELSIDDVGSCFYVLPYRGSSDYGIKSNVICVPAPPVTLSAAKIETAHYYHNFSYGACPSPDSNPTGYTIGYKETQPTGSTFTAGFLDRAARSATSDGGCNNYYDEYQGIVSFDLAALKNKHIAHATLHVTIDKSGVNVGDPASNDGSEQSGRYNCALSAGFPTNTQSGLPSIVAYGPGVSLHNGNSQLAIDVTGMVNAWLAPGGVNRGIVFSGPLTDWTSFTNTTVYKGANAECITLYSDPKLEVTFQ